MRLEDIEDDLQVKVLETAKWLSAEEPAVITGLQARGSKCEARALNLIKDERRKEKDGVRFELVFGRPDRMHSAEVSVRIKATSSESATADGIANGPYVAVYVIEPESGKEELCYHETFENPVEYFRSGEDEIQEWYARWLRRLLREGNDGKVFRHMVSLSS